MVSKCIIQFQGGYKQSKVEEYQLWTDFQITNFTKILPVPVEMKHKTKQSSPYTFINGLTGQSTLN